MTEKKDVIVAGMLAPEVEPGLYQLAPGTLITKEALEEACENFNTRPPWTKAMSAALPEETKLEMLKGAKGGTWYDGWQPYCMTCSTMHRMHKEPYGFRCNNCGNMIAWDLTRLAESPLNRRKEATEREPMYGPSPLAGIHIAVASGAIGRLLRDHGACVVEVPLPLGLEIPHHKANFSIGFDVEPYMEFFSGQLGIPYEPSGHEFVGHMGTSRCYRARHFSDQPPEPTSHCGEGYKDPDKYSRKTHGDIGPTGRPTRHRKLRKIRKASRQTNRRRR